MTDITQELAHAKNCLYVIEKLLVNSDSINVQRINEKLCDLDVAVQHMMIKWDLGIAAQPSKEKLN